MPRERCFSTWIRVLRSYGVEVDMNLHKSKPLDKPNEEAVRRLLPDLRTGRRARC